MLSRAAARRPKGHFAALACALALAAALPARAEPAARPRGDAAARLSSAAAASEYWDLTARFATGERIFTRFLITNEGPGRRTGVAFGQLVFPDRAPLAFTFGQNRENWTLSPDGLRMKISSAVLDLHGPQRRFEIDSNKRSIRLAFEFPAGAALPASGAAAPPHVDLLELATPIRGSLWVAGMPAPRALAGSLALTHVWMDADESALSLRRIEFFGERSPGEQDGLALYASEDLTPNGERRRFLAIERAGGAVYRSDRFELDASGAADGEPGYPVPRRLRLANDALRLEIRQAGALVRAKPLDAIPQPFRWLLSLRSDPRQIWEDASFELVWSGPSDPPAGPIRGDGITAVRYLNPLP